MTEKPTRTSPKRSARDQSEPRAEPRNGLTAQQWHLLKHQLLEERAQVRERTRRHEELAREGFEPAPDEFDIASEESDRSVTLRLLDKERKLLAELDHALNKLETGEYGLCEGSDEPIGFPRLSARPWARYSLTYKEELEATERGYAKD